ncbi:ABC transporter ATP-binding protein [Mesobacillus selenatarsenatis]|uniref:ABC transporter, ATP-binding protein n=1 Tax=Mesobacillus selenatarsenatis (strain DSM 18680 / JCM 14380 / FERM P-15431 / SF-1) TaxID=1321606 RepID=A0A0A8X9J2_MESS1|nr:ABC transporter ATP-binding protein [Mesobacillus selenatarsenatis]GAM16640.1 ABC transporter, ATP-binding protein [Mesobacillus selenatarsenatis SF-1]
METVLEVSNIGKRFKNGRGISDINFSIEKGNVFGLIGPNGAGKTTLMKAITGLLKPDTGKVKISGKNLEEDYKSAIRDVGANIGSASIYSHLTAWQNLKMIIRFYPEQPISRIDDVLKSVGLSKYKHDKVSSYSMGMVQRLGLAAALLPKPKLIILDEPANGLDIDGMLVFRNVVRQLSDEGVTFLISSHLTSELDKFCTHFGILIDGELQCIVRKDLFSAGKSIEDLYVERIGGVHVAGIC